MSITALITGASGGIGYEIAKIHASKGGDLVLVARTRAKLDKLKSDLERKHQIRVYIIEKDLSLNNSAQEVYDEVKKLKIKVDYLINNAGFGDFGLFSETSWDKTAQMIDLNIKTLTHLTRLFLPDMQLQGEGKILNVASTASFQPGPLMAVYYATKAYVLSFSQAIANEVNDQNITVTALCPGPTESGFVQAAGLDESKLFKRNNVASSKDVAHYGYKAMMKGRTVVIHGLVNRTIANIVPFFSRKFVTSMVRKVQEKTKQVA